MWAFSMGSDYCRSCRMLSCGRLRQSSNAFMHQGLRQRLLHRWLISLVPQNLCPRSSLMWQTLGLSCCRLWQLQEPAVAAEPIAATAAKDSYHGLAVLTDSQGAAVPCPPAWPLHSLQGRLPCQHWPLQPGLLCQGCDGGAAMCVLLAPTEHRLCKDVPADPTCRSAGVKPVPNHIASQAVTGSFDQRGVACQSSKSWASDAFLQGICL